MPTEKQQQRNRFRLPLLLGCTTLFMFTFGFALVPIYNVMCQQLGINGKTGTAVDYSANHAVIDQSRTVTVQFLATNNEQLPWEFRPNIREIRFHPGEMRQITYHAKNLSDHEMIVQAIPSVTPSLAAKYLKKTECFCFQQQTLASEQSMDMPILFHIDPDLPQKIHTITLSYTLFDVTQARFKNKVPTGKIN